MSERTERLKQLLRNPLVQVNWCDTLANSNGWEIIHATIGRTDVLILGMGRSGYQVHKINHGPPQGESVEAEALRLAGKSAEEPEPDTSHDGIFA